MGCWSHRVEHVERGRVLLSFCGHRGNVSQGPPAGYIRIWWKVPRRNMARKAHVGCTLHCLEFCRQWREWRGRDFFARWLSQECSHPTALLSILNRGGALMQSYLLLVRSEQEAQLGIALDSFCTPEEVQTNIQREPLASIGLWQPLREFMGQVPWVPLSYGGTLEAPQLELMTASLIFFRAFMMALPLRQPCSWPAHTGCPMWAERTCATCAFPTASPLS